MNRVSWFESKGEINSSSLKLGRVKVPTDTNNITAGL